MKRVSAGGVTWLGLTTALVGGPILIAIQKSATGPVSNIPQTLLREGMLFGLGLVLILLIKYGERLPLSSVGLRTDRKGQTLLLGLGITVALALGALSALLLLRLAGLPAPKLPDYVPPAPVFTLVIVRAGIIEELFYRGYAIERLESLTGKKWIAAVVPLAFFVAAHFKGGVSGMAVAFVLGAILTAFYMWKRNLAANILGHFLIDFIPNVLLPALSG